MANLPSHIILEEILPRLPIKSVIRFKCVSKEWYGAITSLHFARKHLVKSHISDCFASKFYGFYIDDEHNLGIASIDNGNVSFQSRVWFLDEGEQNLVLMFGSADGLVGFIMYDYIFDPENVHELNSDLPKGGIHFIIYNPIVGEKCFVESHLSSEVILGNDSGFNRIQFGFLYVPSIDDYLIIALSLPSFDTYEGLIVYVYSLKYQSWDCVLIDKLERILEFYVPWYSSENLVVQNNLHWIAVTCSHELVIAYLDVYGNTFSSFDLPSMGELPSHVALCCLDERLCVWGSTERSHIHLWIMKDYGGSWDHVCALSVNEVCYDILGSVNLALIRNRKCLLLANLCDDTPKMLSIDFGMNKIINYFPSLISPLLVSNNHSVTLDLEIEKGLSFSDFVDIGMRVTCCHFSSDGKLFAMGGNKNVELWLMDSLQQMLSFEGHSHFVSDVRFNPNKPWLATSSLDGNIRVWDADQGHLLNQFTGGHPVMSVDFHPSDTTLVCFNNSIGEVCLWRLFDSCPLVVLEGGTVQVRFQPCGKYLAAVSEYLVYVIDLESQHTVVQLQGHSQRFRSCCWDPTGRLLACVSEDMISIWHVGYGWRRWRCVHQLTSTGNQFYNCVFHHVYPFLLVIGCNKNLELWNVANNKTTTLVAHERRISCLASSISGLVASASHRDVKLWQSA